MSVMAMHTNRVGDGTPVIKDRWIYQWEGKDAPREFLLHKVLFRSMSPVDIVTLQCSVLEGAVNELTQHLHVPKEHLRNPKTDWLCLQGHDRLKCQVGTYQDQFVVAANRITKEPTPFIPSRFFRTLVANPEWKDMTWYASHRRMCVNFHTGLSFHSDRFDCSCDVVYHLHFGVHGVNSIWASVSAESDDRKRVMAVPFRLPISADLSDLPGKIQNLSGKCERFICRMGSSWLGGHDLEEIGNMALGFIKGLPVPSWRRDEMVVDQELSGCATRLDMLLFLAKVFQNNPVGQASDLIQLSKNVSKDISLS